MCGRFTNMPTWAELKELYQISDQIAPTTNLELRDFRKADVGAAVWSRFSQPKDKTISHYRELAAAFQRRLPGQLADELAEIVEALAEPDAVSLQSPPLTSSADAHLM